MEHEKDRRDRALAAAVAAGRADALRVWPDLLGAPQGDDTAFPTSTTDMSSFRWEKPSQARAEQELEMLMHGARVTLPDPQDHPARGKQAPVAVPPPPRDRPVKLRPGQRRQAADASELEWN